MHVRISQFDPDTVTVACPDAKNPLVFELRRIREE
jgi:uncharacterized repeat protein (TIGR04076 family)